MTPTHTDRLDSTSLARLRRRMARPRLRAGVAAAPPRAPALLKLLATSALSRAEAITAMDGDRAATATAFDWLRTSGLIEPCGSNIAGRPFRARPGATLQATA